MSNLNEIIACTLGKDMYDTYEEDFSGIHMNTLEEDLDSIESILKDLDF